MKLLTYYTESHKKLLEGCFLPSIPAGDNFDLSIGTGTQHSEDGGYYSPGFARTTQDKISFILRNLSEMDNGERLLYSDCDVVFLKPVMKLLSEYEDFDMVFQNGYYQFNTGFFLMRNSLVVRTLLRETMNSCTMHSNDQDALNCLIETYRESNVSTLRYTKFDRRVMSPANFIHPDMWTGQEITVPDSALVFHACWCVGIENKLRLLQSVRGAR